MMEPLEDGILLVVAVGLTDGFPEATGVVDETEWLDSGVELEQSLVVPEVTDEEATGELATELEGTVRLLEGVTGVLEGAVWLDSEAEMELPLVVPGVTEGEALGELVTELEGTVRLLECGELDGTTVEGVELASDEEGEAVEDAVCVLEEEAGWLDGVETGEGVWELVWTTEMEGVDGVEGVEVGVTKMVEVVIGGDGSHSWRMCFMCWV